MISNKMSFLILLLFLTLIPLTSASRTLASSSLGYLLHYMIESPTDLKVGIDTPINFTFKNGGSTMFAKSIWISIWGADINSTETGINRLVAKDIELHTFDSVNETILVRPLEEGTVTYMVSAEYNWTDTYGNPRNDWGNDEIFIDAKINIYDELLVSENIFKYSTFILSATTIAFVLSTAYFVRKTQAKI